MPANTADRCKETTTSTGTGTITLAGAASQFQSFVSAFGSAPRLVEYAIVGQTGTEWEVGRGTFDGSTGLAREQVLESSNSDALVNFSAGTKDVFATFSGRSISEVYGADIAFNRGAFLP